jgi:hypothetical protein
MTAFYQYIPEYKKQLSQGMIQKAYKGLMDYILDLRTSFKNHYPDYIVSSNIYFGYMDMTYFSVIPESLKQRNLKIAIVFLHEACRFEAWLAGSNKQVQAEFWNLIKTSGWNKYPLVENLKGEDAILRHVLIEDPDFGDLDALTQKIDVETLGFIREVEGFLSTLLPVTA